jgi:hypothetical protein
MRLLKKTANGRVYEIRVGKDRLKMRRVPARELWLVPLVLPVPREALTFSSTFTERDKAFLCACGISLGEGSRGKN